MRTHLDQTSFPLSAVVPSTNLKSLPTRLENLGFIPEQVIEKVREILERKDQLTQTLETYVVFHRSHPVLAAAAILEIAEKTDSIQRSETEFGGCKVRATSVHSAILRLASAPGPDAPTDFAKLDRLIESVPTPSIARDFEGKYIYKAIMDAGKSGILTDGYGEAFEINTSLRNVALTFLLNRYIFGGGFECKHRAQIQLAEYSWSELASTTETHLPIALPPEASTKFLRLIGRVVPMNESAPSESGVYFLDCIDVPDFRQEFMGSSKPSRITLKEGDCVGTPISAAFELRSEETFLSALTRIAERQENNSVADALARKHIAAQRTFIDGLLTSSYDYRRDFDTIARFFEACATLCSSSTRSEVSTQHPKLFSGMSVTEILPYPGATPRLTGQLDWLGCAHQTICVSDVKRCHADLGMVVGPKTATKEFSNHHPHGHHLTIVRDEPIHRTVGNIALALAKLNYFPREAVFGLIKGPERR